MDHSAQILTFAIYLVTCFELFHNFCALCIQKVQLYRYIYLENCWWQLSVCNPRQQIEGYKMFFTNSFEAAE